MRITTTLTGPQASATTEVVRLSTLLSRPGAVGATGPEGPAGPIGLTWLPGWLADTAYLVRDAFEHNGTSYRCTVAHTSGAATEPGVGADWETVWAVVAAKGDQGDIGPNLPAATQIQAEDPSGTTLLNWTAQRIHQAIAYALGLWKSIAGQRDILTVLAAPADGGTVTVDCSLGNAFQITPTDTSGMDYVVDFTNIPEGSTFFAISFLTVVGTNIPTVTYQVEGVPVTPLGTPSFTASKKNQWTVATWDNGTTLLISGAAY